MTNAGPDHPFVSDLRALGVPVTIRPLRGRRYLAEADEIASLLQQLRIDVVHTHVYRADFIGYLAARKTGVAAVTTFHGETGGDWLNRLYEWSVKRLFKRFDAVVCVSEVNRDKLRAAGSDLANAHLVRNGAAIEEVVDRAAARKALGLGDADVVVGWIGRLSHEKGPDLLLDAIDLLKDDAPQVLFIGDGPMRAELEARVRRIRSRVTFAGSLPKASRLVKAFDLLAMSGRMEGMPMVMLEALSAGVPVTGFLVGGIPDVLSEKTGWPVPAGNVSALALAIAAALGDRRAAADRARAGEGLVRRDYSLQSWVDAMERVYETALAKKQDPVVRRVPGAPTLSESGSSGLRR